MRLISETGATALSVSSFADAIANGATLPARVVVITFDDGLADFRDAALPVLRELGLAATLYVTTGFLDDAPRVQQLERPEGAWLDSLLLPHLGRQGIEVGGHSHSHPELDTLPLEAARREIELCKRVLEDLLQGPVRSFAYPHGYLSEPVRRLVREAGYESACTVRNALSSTGDDPLALARLTVRRTTSLTQIAAWLDGRGAPVAAHRELARTRAWRTYRRGRALVGRRLSSADG
jgi:peptidoglycan/xylan/chitin deacetylase (PgdA/CDA1 family)